MYSRVERLVFAHSLNLINWKHEEMQNTIYLLQTKLYLQFPSLIHHISKKCITDKKVFSILKSERRIAYKIFVTCKTQVKIEINVITHVEFEIKITIELYEIND